jgi:DNA-binding NarL/FixJ family response regulator
MIGGEVLMSIRVLIADDEHYTRKHVRALLNEQKDVTVVAETGDAGDIKQLVRKHKPDVILMDVVMPRMDGIEATCQLRAIFPRLAIVALSGHLDEDLVRGMFKAGASGYLFKPCSGEDLIDGIRDALANRLPLGPAIRKVMLNSFMRASPGTDSALISTLTARERDVLRLIADGLSTKEVAQRLKMEIRTVEKHRQMIMIKLNVHNIAELTKCAVKAGIISL